MERPFWQPRFCDFNVYTDGKRIEKRRYIHRNPFTRGLVDHPKHWKSSSYRYWACGVNATVQMNSTWTYEQKMQHALRKQFDR